MRHGSLGPILTVQRVGKHGRLRSRRLAHRQLRERARSRRQEQAQVLEGRMVTSQGKQAARTIQSYIAPIHPDGRTIR